MPRSSHAPTVLHDRLRARRSELEQTALARIHSISDPASPDPTYFSGLRSALTAALDYGLAAIQSPGLDPDPIPVDLLAQARLAARNGVGLDAVLRRYSAGHSLLADTLLEEATPAGVSAADLQALLRSLAVRFDRVVSAVSEEYAREVQVRPPSLERRRAELIDRLLRGELLDTSDLAYNLESVHLAIHAIGADAPDAIRDAAASLDRRVIVVRHDHELTWAWLGGTKAFDPDELSQLTSYPWPLRIRVAFGEPAENLPGWRLTHRQAAATLPIALRGTGGRVVRYGAAPLLAAALHDDLLAVSLDRLFLDPLRRERDGGETARATLRAYFAAGRNLSSAAVSLGVNRRTVSSRLIAIEERLGRSLSANSAEFETALRLDKMDLTQGNGGGSPSALNRR